MMTPLGAKGVWLNSATGIVKLRTVADTLCCCCCCSPSFCFAQVPQGRRNYLRLHVGMVRAASRVHDLGIRGHPSHCYHRHLRSRCGPQHRARQVRERERRFFLYSTAVYRVSHPPPRDIMGGDVQGGGGWYTPARGYTPVNCGTYHLQYSICPKTPFKDTLPLQMLDVSPNHIRSDANLLVFNLPRSILALR